MAYTIALTMTRSVLSRYDDSTQVVIAGSSGQVGDVSSKTYTAALDAELRAYSAGRRRMVASALTTRSITVVLRSVTSDQAATLEAWRGVVLVYRDWTGVMQIGSYTTCTVVPIRGAPF